MIREIRPQDGLNYEFFASKLNELIAASNDDHDMIIHHDRDIAELQHPLVTVDNLLTAAPNPFTYHGEWINPEVVPPEINQRYFVAFVNGEIEIGINQVSDVQWRIPAFNYMISSNVVAYAKMMSHPGEFK